MRKVFLALSSVAFIYFATSPCVKAQTTGSILGYVKDSTGAIVPGTTITVTNPPTGFSWEATSDEQGYYFVPSLPVGTYTVSATMPGFKTFTQANVVVDVARNVRVDISLQVGEVAETVEVFATATGVETRSPTLGETVEQRRVMELPLNGRNFLQLATLQPGAVPGIRLASGLSFPGPGSSANSPQVNGLRGQSNSFLLDGANNNDAFLGEGAVVPPPDAIQEFRILTNLYSAEYGRGGGSIISVITRSGTNRIHGSVYEFLRNDVLDATNFFSQEKSPLRRNQFGFTLGGPIRKDRTLVFGAYEGFREVRNVSLAATVPSAAQRNGNFSALNPAPKSCSERGAICDPTTRQPFPGNIIPADRIGPIARNILRFYPLPNDPSGAPVHRFQGAEPTISNQFTVRLDHDISDKQKLTGRYSLYDGENKLARAQANFGATIALPAFRNVNKGRFQNLVLADTYVFSPNLINTVRLGFFRFAGKSLFADEPAVTIRDLGFRYPVSVADEFAYPQIIVAGLSAVGYPTGGPAIRAENTFQLDNDVIYSKSNYTLKFGVQLSRIRHTFPLAALGSGGIVPYLGSRTGNPVADMLIDFPALFQQVAGRTDNDWRSFWAQAYFQGDLRVAPRFTLNLGIRYELKTPYKELRNRRATFQTGAQSTVFPEANTGQLFFGDPGVTDTTVKLQTKDFAPRIGFAWDVFGDGSTSLRAGYGIFFDTSTFFMVRSSAAAPPFQSIVTTFPTPALLPDPFAANPIIRPDSPLVPFIRPYQLTFLSPTWRNPYAQQWNLTLEHQLPADFLIQLAYVGTAGRNLPGTRNLNVARFIPGVDPNTGQPFTTPGNSQSRRPFPQFAGLLQQSTEFNSQYNKCSDKV